MKDLRGRGMASTAACVISISESSLSNMSSMGESGSSCACLPNLPAHRKGRSRGRGGGGGKFSSLAMSFVLCQFDLISLFNLDRKNLYSSNSLKGEKK